MANDPPTGLMDMIADTSQIRGAFDMRAAAAKICHETCLDIGAAPGSSIHAALVEASGRIKMLPIPLEEALDG